jgi:phosphoribosylanthranilate isomerase
MNRTRIKICGITRPQDGFAAANLGADAIGLVFYSKSARAIDVTQATRIIRALPPFIATVGLFVNAEPKEISAVLRRLPLQLLQFHGDEEPDYCNSFGLPYIKAVPMGIGADVQDYAHRFESAAALLLDSHGGARTGGSGYGFDWSLIPSDIGKPIILAGGLNPDNVTQALQRIRPFAVDVSSGVESTKGIKDIGLMYQFIRRVQGGESCA